MQHFFVVPDQVRDGYIEITGSDVNHMKNVLRMKTGEQLEISDGNNKKYLCEIESLEADKVTAQILEEREAENELPSKIYLFQGLPKSDKMELIIQKAVELGAWEVIPRQNVSQFGSCSAIRSRGCAGGCSLAGRDGVCGLLVSGLAARRNAETACVKRLACSSSAAAAAADSCTSDAFCCVTRSISETANAT